MKDSLKEFIHQNRDSFDDKVPAEKVWRKIGANLPVTKTITLWNSVSVWRAAAILCMGLSVYVFLTGSQSPIHRKEVAKLQGEFSDLDIYYNSEIAEKVALINGFDDQSKADQFTQDFQKLDAMYQVLKEQMKLQPTQKVKDALILNLLIRIDLLNQQIYKLEDSTKKEKKDIQV